jgi:hypothetical protein
MVMKTAGTIARMLHAAGIAGGSEPQGGSVASRVPASACLAA